MKESLLRILICPMCQGKLELTIRERDQEIAEGDLFCKDCHGRYPIQHYVPRFVNTDEYVRSFSVEWTVHKDTQLDSFSGTNESEDTFGKATGFDLQDLGGRLVLDVGCGAGRFLEVAGKHGAEVVGVDMSFAVDSAFRNLGFKENVHVVQADIFALPFRNGVFDYIFSIGVLHHTPNTKEAFGQLPGLLEEGGRIAVWVYPNGTLLVRMHHKVSDFYRIFTTRMPWRLLYYLCYLSVPLYYPKRMPLIGRMLKGIVPTSMHPNPRWRILDTFDWYSPKYQWKHTYGEVVSWFEETGLVDIVELRQPVSVQGSKR